MRASKTLSLSNIEIETAKKSFKYVQSQNEITSAMKQSHVKEALDVLFQQSEFNNKALFYIQIRLKDKTITQEEYLNYLSELKYQFSGQFHVQTETLDQKKILEALSNQQIKEIDQAWGIVDKNKIGVIKSTDIDQAIIYITKRYRISKENVQEMIMHLQYEHQYIYFEQFANYFADWFIQHSKKYKRKNSCIAFFS